MFLEVLILKTELVRDIFINYFKKNGHTIVPSSTLIPRNDPTLLFANAGMNQFKDVFLGYDKRNYTRATSCQKCVRAGGKHNDLENVGFTYRHHTFFEMLGNFSFGDYFKKEAIAYSWELLTKEYKIPIEKLYVTVFKDDEESFNIWNKEIGVPKEKIFKMGEKDNFWSMGEQGPCGPCSEIFFDHGPEHGCNKKDCNVGCSCDRYVEIWNLVFMQFNRDQAGKLTELPKPSIDTGAGLERLSAVLQGVASNYDIDIFLDIKKEIEKGAVHKLDNKDFQASYNVIADHLRSIAFLISDGCMPSNEGAGYVLRRIIRRAVRHGKLIGFEAPFMYKKISKVTELMGKAYPELLKTNDHIQKILKIEEEKFFETLDKGLVILEKEISKMSSKKILNGEIAFKLYDTYGFPLDLTEIISKEKGVTVDTQAFEEEMKKQKDLAKKGSSFSTKKEDELDYDVLSKEIQSNGIKPTEFLGYDKMSSSAKLKFVFKSGKTTVLVFDKTPFYAESGGQVCDLGKIEDKKAAHIATVTNVIKPVAGVYLHIVESDYDLKINEEYVLTIDKDRRKLIQRNHTSTHILHYLLRKHLGEHAKQAGSSVADDMFRFDFNHYEAISSSKLKEIEDEFNKLILAADDVKTNIMSYKEAVDKGALALFDEKYEDKVRVISVGDYSTELCGGTHIKNTSEIGVFKIKGEFSIGSGLRRIEALTSLGAYNFMASDSVILQDLIKQTKSTREEFKDKIVSFIEENKTLRKELEKLKSGNIKSDLETAINDALDLNGIKSVFLGLDGLDMKQLRESGEYIKDKLKNGIAVVYSVVENRFLLVVCVSKNLSSKIKAMEIIKFISEKTASKGGGSAEFAQGGGNDISLIKNSKNEVLSFISNKIME
jgi:alanyl-tRNA synthetase